MIGRSFEPTLFPPRAYRVALLAPLLAFAAAASGCRPESEASAAPKVDPSIPVQLAEVQPGPVSRPVRGTGIVRLKSEADLSFKVGGVIAAIAVEEGATVKRGQVLARLDPTEVESSLRQAKEASVKAERDLARVQRLFDSGALPAASLDDARTGAEVARAAVTAASFNASRSTIVAPDDGRIDRRLAEAGEVAAPGRPIFHMSGRSRGAVVRVGLTDRDVLRVKEGDAATVVLDARPEQPLSGTVTQIATVATPGSGTFDIEVRLDGAPRDLLSGLSAKVAIAHDEAAAAVVPLGSLVDGKGDDAAVFVVKEGRAGKVPVKVAFLFGDRAALASSPLTPGARIVLAGAGQISEGSLVRVVP
ncbi:MAG: efflux RND transporter periplasmic adaptor subunit [Deltaproteobacteria bacterium]|nr:efflux RND transporter periplasmic adaptor subunit [Deltaproteobacteria bacterium]